jgi:L-ascorbate metabolism protein UlaG (beta-lactamase superfamily)
MAVEITWIQHASFRLAGTRVVYIDPWKIPTSPRDGNVVFVSHSHHDHCSPADVAKVLASDGVVVGPADALEQTGAGKPLAAGAAIDLEGVKITGVPAYNIAKAFHPKANKWLGAVIEMDGVRVYYAGDTDQIEEMEALEKIDVALLPVGGTYTLDAAEAARAAEAIGCKAAIPYHFGDIVGSTADAERFAQAAGCQVRVLTPGRSVTI